ncbi:DUF2746 domain-containing protein [Gordonia sp. ABSL1-1]|uniref:DUF2746 domain-containing protein n=1 Tax=Gordonia sp. ABSL1-1 TaxID=3053923 RepID=UPI0025744B17|nr:DUF2746 domain-containing protein [Gordonia sp. ABSL1-1]MDL9938672.1 DUF2746 domain-containing protein [Gordonia sp. ABSL1-1]
MSTPGLLPDDIWGLLGLLLAVAIPAATTVVVTRIQSSRATAKHEKLAAGVEVIKEQVANDHTSNLRHDLDRNERKVDQVDTKVDRLSGELRSLARVVESSMVELRASAARQDRIAAKHHPEDMQ